MNSNRLLRSPLAVAGLVAALMVGGGLFASTATCVAQPRKEIPAEWFYDGANRPKALKDLEGKPAAALAAETWIGQSTTIEANLGKVVVLDFWATWCGPCMASIPKNIQMVTDYKDKGLVFLGVHDSANGWDRADAVVKEKGINYPVLKDKGGDTVKAYNLQFWPTYVAIDRKGIVRAAGLLPDRVHDVVEILLAEEAPAGLGGSGGGNAPSWYYAGAARPAWLKAIEGKPLPVLDGTKWSGEAAKAEELKGKVIVIQFMAHDSTVAMSQLAELNKLQPELGPQGVAFIGVCDSRAAWDGMTGAGLILKGASPKVSVMQDAALHAEGAEGGKTEGDKKEGDAPKNAEPARAPASGEKTPPVIKSGKLAAALGVRLTPTIIVVDRTGKVRAAGVKVEKVKEIINKLLAEPMPEAAEPAPAPAAPAK